MLFYAPVLASPDLSRLFKLEINASAVGAGAVLLQEDAEGVDHPVCYFSRKFNTHQLKYSVIEKETLSLLLAHFEVYVGSSPLPIVVYTDHNPLVFLAGLYNHNQRLMLCWCKTTNLKFDIRNVLKMCLQNVSTMFSYVIWVLQQLVA